MPLHLFVMDHGPEGCEKHALMSGYKDLEEYQQKTGVEDIWVQNPHLWWITEHIELKVLDKSLIPVEAEDQVCMMVTPNNQRFVVMVKVFKSGTRWFMHAEEVIEDAKTSDHQIPD